ncbi:MAG: ATPase, T2SS/T4P/T4SS family [Tepidisphaeraceae bacterium]
MAIAIHPQLEQALRFAYDGNATDLFLIAGEPLAYRLNNQIQRADGKPLDAAKIEAVVDAAIGRDAAIAQLSAAGKAQTSLALEGGIHGQMTVTRVGGVFSVVIRLLRGAIYEPAQIALPQAVLDATKAERGLIVFTGPIGSGKTTSLLSTLDHINATQSRVINTVEDPIAIAGMTPKRSLIVQRELGTDVPDFRTGISVSIAQDADVLFVGELRSPDDVAAVVHVAQVRCLVLTQMHQPTAVRAIQRMIEVQPADTALAFRRQLAETLRCVVAQTLVPRAGGKGKVAAYGVLVPTDAQRQAILDGTDIPDSPVTIDTHMRQLVADGIIAPT